MEKLRKRQRVELVQPESNPKKYRKLIADPLFKGRKIFSNNLVAVHIKKGLIRMERPIYVGFTVLELSKLCMYQFYYNILKEKVCWKCRISIYRYRLIISDNNNE